MTANRFVRITPDVMSSADVFPRVDIALQEARSRKRAADPDEHTFDPHQIDLWDTDPDHAPDPALAREQLGPRKNVGDQHFFGLTGMSRRV
ncbi:hypothetical protein [Paraburkholderia sp. JHI869]|uniref:hypothetical protein n=1 Tax=Paraburkholderia sp. JHI869 TaxID=3112959 RepID=UPI0031759AF5